VSTFSLIPAVLSSENKGFIDDFRKLDEIFVA